MELKRLSVGSFENICYVPICPRTRESAIIDPAAEPEKILRAVQEIRVKYILITHGHMDHIGALKEVQEETGAPVGIHEQDARALFPNGPGNTAIPRSDYREILRSIHSKIFPLPDDTVIYPGHGLETTVGKEKATSFYPLPQEAERRP